MKLQPVCIHRSVLKPFKIPNDFVLIQDTREQRPLFETPPEGLQVVTKTLYHGDYSIKGFEDRFAVERKQFSDFYSYIGRERQRTVKKMEQFRTISLTGGFAALVIEATESDILSGYHMSRVTPETARQALISFEVRYGINVYYSKSRSEIRRWILDRAIKFYRLMRESH